MRRVYTVAITVLALVMPGAAAHAARDAGRAARVTTGVSADTVTVGERFHVTYQVTYADSLSLVEPILIAPGTCRVVESRWEHADGGAVRGQVVFILVSIDSVRVPEQVFLFVTGHGDTLRAWSEPVDLEIRFLSAESQDLRPLKEQWTMPPNWLWWILAGAGVLALAGATAWWIRRRRARRPVADVPRVLIPPDIEALTELERIEAMGLVARGEFKTFYTLVIDAVRRYLEARFGVEALDRTTHELLRDLARRGDTIQGLGALLEEADLVKFAKYKPDVTHAEAAMKRARDVVVSSTPRAVGAQMN
ncbi:MAG TPA: DUF4381 family protein [Candidatus Krumholzibacteria bacterium]|nr:DUF4381 family protein [Candidatus Krumholzibacteria bacterium]